MANTKPKSSQVTYQPAGVGAVATDVQSKLRSLELADYTALRTFTGTESHVQIVADGITGLFKYDPVDTTTVDNGGTVIVDGAGRRWKRVFDGVVSVLWFGAVGDGVTNNSPAILLAINANVKTLYFPSGSYVFESGLTLGPSNSGLKITGDGITSTTLIKKFSGDLFTLSSCSNFECSSLKADGQFGSQTGKFAVLSGTSHFPIFHDFITEGFSGPHIECDGNAGFGASIFNHHARLGVGQTVCTGFSLSGRDIGYAVRRLTDCNYSGPIDLSQGCNNFYITGGQFTNVITSALCGNLFILGSRWGNAGTTVSIFGNTIVNGCSFAQSIVLDASFDGSFVGNKQTGGSAPYFTNNSPGCQVYHLDPSGLFHINKAKIEYQKAGEIEICSSVSIGDTNYTYVFGASPAIVLFSTAFTVNRTVTLPATGGRAGTRVRFVRNAGDSGGPWQLTIGATSKSINAFQWCDVLFNGSFWLITGSGSL